MSFLLDSQLAQLSSTLVERDILIITSYSLKVRSQTMKTFLTATGVQPPASVNSQ